MIRDVLAAISVACLIAGFDLDVIDRSVGRQGNQNLLFAGGQEGLPDVMTTETLAA